MFGGMEGPGLRGAGGKEKEWTDCVSVGKKIEHVVRFVRPYVTPARYRSYRNTRRRAQGLEDKKTVCFDFSSTLIDYDHARYLFQIVKEAELAGFQIAYRDRFKFLANFDVKGYKQKLLQKNFCIYSSESELAEPVLLITDSKKVIESSLFVRKVWVDYTKRKALGNEFALPFSVNPNLLDGLSSLTPELLPVDRPVKILLAGNINPKQYDKKLIGELFQMMTRYEVTSILRQQNEIPFRELTRQVEYENLFEDDDVLLLMNSENCRVPFEMWLHFLSQADFYMACAGAHMPMSHNLIEAMSVGSIPILEYAEYLKPSLEHGVNALVYRNKEELLEVLKEAVSMPESKKFEMRENVSRYYQNYLSPGKLIPSILSRQESLTLVIFDFTCKK